MYRQHFIVATILPIPLGDFFSFILFYIVLFFLRTFLSFIPFIMACIYSLCPSHTSFWCCSCNNWHHCNYTSEPTYIWIHVLLRLTDLSMYFYAFVLIRFCTPVSFLCSLPNQQKTSLSSEHTHSQHKKKKFPKVNSKHVETGK